MRPDDGPDAADRQVDGADRDPEDDRDRERHEEAGEQRGGCGARNHMRAPQRAACDRSGRAQGWATLASFSISHASAGPM